MPYFEFKYGYYVNFHTKISTLFICMHKRNIILSRPSSKCNCDSHNSQNYLNLQSRTSQKYKPEYRLEE